jgi:hypothetical protein
MVMGLYYVWQRPTRALLPRMQHRAPSSIDLKKNSQPGIFEMLSQDQKMEVMQAVQIYCSNGYERNSCLHYLITCGEPCFRLVKPERRRQIVNDFNQMRKEHHLTEVPLPPEVEEE